MPAAKTQGDRVPAGKRRRSQTRPCGRVHKVPTFGRPEVRGSPVPGGLPSGAARRSEAVRLGRGLGLGSQRGNASVPNLASTTVVTSLVARLRVSCNGGVARTPDATAATPTCPRLPRHQAGGSTSAAPAPDRRAAFSRRPVGQLTDRRRDRLGGSREGDKPVPARPTPRLVVGQPDLLLGRLEGDLDRPPSPGRLGRPGQRRAARAGRQVERHPPAVVVALADQQPAPPLRPQGVVVRQPRPGVPPRPLAPGGDRDPVPGPLRQGFRQGGDRRPTDPRPLVLACDARVRAGRRGRPGRGRGSRSGRTSLRSVRRPRRAAAPLPDTFEADGGAGAGHGDPP